MRLAPGPRGMGRLDRGRAFHLPAKPTHPTDKIEKRGEVWTYTPQSTS